MSVARKAGKGFVSYLFRSMLEKLMGIVAMIFLARRLTPYDFGLVSITEVLLYLISVLGTTGLAEFLLAYRKEDIQAVFRAAFWFNLFLTVVILALFLLFMPFWAQYQHDARIIKIGLISGGIFLFSQLQTIPKTWLSKHLQFDKQVKLQAPFIIIVPLLKIAAVFSGFGVYSLILPTLIIQPILTWLLYKKTELHIAWDMQRHRWKEIYHFTKHLIGANIFTRITDQGDKFILGKFLGLGKLGIYNIAYQLADLFTSPMVQVSNNILSSVLPKYVDDKEKFYRYYITFLKAFSLVAFPMLAIMFIAAKPVILILYGSKWVEAVLPLRILIVLSAFKAVTSSYGCVMNSFHLNKKSFIVTAVYGPVHLAASAIGASLFGIAGVAAAVTTVKIIFINWNIRQVMDAVARPFSAWYRQLSPYFLVNLILAVCFTVILSISASTLHPYFQIAIAIAGFVMVYFILFRFLLRHEVQTVGVFLQKAFPESARYFNILFGI